MRMNERKTPINLDKNVKRIYLYTKRSHKTCSTKQNKNQFQSYEIAPRRHHLITLGTSLALIKRNDFRRIQLVYPIQRQR